MFRRTAAWAALLLALGVLWPHGTALAGAPEAAREDIPELLRKVRSAPTATDRIQAIRSLGRLDNAASLRQFRVVEGLIKLVRNPGTGARERKALLVSLRQICLLDKTYRSQISTLMIETLRNQRELVVLRIEALEFFRVTITEPDAPGEFNSLREIFTIADGPRDTPVLVVKALEVIGDIAPARGLDSLKLAVSDENKSVRRAGVAALARYLEKGLAAGGKQTVIIGVLQKLAADKELPSEVRVMALSGLGGLARRSAMPLEIVRAIQPVLEKADDPEVAAAAAGALGMAADRLAADALMQAFGRFKGEDRKRVNMRIACCRSLGEMFGNFARNREIVTAKKISEFLIKVLQDAAETDGIRSAAAFALGNMNQLLFDRRAAARALVGILLDKTADAGLQRVCRESLTFITPTIQETPGDWKAWLDKHEDDLRGNRYKGAGETWGRTGDRIMMRNVCLALVGAAALFATGCRMTDPADREYPVAFTEADRHYKAAKFARARDAFTDFAASDEAGDFKWESLYWAGRSALEIGEVRTAEARFDEVLSARPYRRLRVLALAGKGAAAYSHMPPDYRKAQGFYTDAVRSMDLLSDADRERVEPDKILFFLGMCHWNRRQQPRADALFERVLDAYGDGAFAKDAKKHHSDYGGTPHRGGGWGAEVAVYGTRADAVRRVRALAGQKAYVLELKHERVTRYSVRVGRYRTFVEAEAKCTELRAAGINAVPKP